MFKLIGRFKITNSAYNYDNVSKYYHEILLKGRKNNEVGGMAFYASKTDNVDLEIPKNEVREFYNAHLQSGTGVIYDKKPFRVRLFPNKVYYWCTCGQSKTQPFCDGSHKLPCLKIKLRPVRLEVAKEKDYWLCNCKQTSNRPFCDGTHKQPEIQDK